MKNGNKVRVKFKLDKHRFVVLEVEEEKLPIVRENNREVSRNEKRETRHESMYSLETLSENKGIERPDEKIDIEEQIIERETITERNERLYAAVHKLSPRQQAIIQKVYFEEKSQREVSKELADLLRNGEGLKDFYRFTAQNPHIDLHDACQIVLSRPKASICFYIDEWNGIGRRVTKNRKGIPFYDTDGNKQIVFDLHDTHGDKRYRRLIFPMRRLLYGLDELNGTALAKSNRRDYNKILTGVAAYLDANDYFTEDERRNSLLSEGVAYSLYCKTGFPKDSGIALRGMPYGLDENARLFKEVYLITELAKEDISAAYERRINAPQVIDDIEEETVSDEPVIPSAPEETEPDELKERPDSISATMPEPESQEKPTPIVNPLYARYMSVQAEKPDAAVLIRVGDFYEIFGERAKETAAWLNLTLTGRDVGLPERIPIQDLKIAAEKKEFDILLVFMFDRLGRIPNETPFVLEWFVKTGVEVWSAKEGQQTFETDVDYLMNYIRFWQAGGESRKTSIFVLRGYRKGALATGRRNTRLKRSMLSF